MLPSFQLEVTINRIIREEWGRILAALVSSVGDLQLAEDCLQDAVEAALLDWNNKGLPNSPAAWLISTARRKAIDRFRRDTHFAKLQPELSYLLDLANDSCSQAEALEAIPDKRLELIFTCCHPALDKKSRIALTLRTLGGLTTEEIAHAFLDKPKAMAQRLVRAKKKISLAGIPYEVPQLDVLPERIQTVIAVIYLIFNEGYSASSGLDVARGDLAEEAIRLARIALDILPEETEVAGLLSLMLLHDSRRSSRQSSQGDIIALEHQNRYSWDKAKISEGVDLLKRTLKKQRVGVYQLQAAISALHAEAVNWQATDWKQISALYNLLYDLQPTAVVQLNRAVALSYSDSPQSALQLLNDVGASGKLDDYQPYFAARSDVLLRCAKRKEAISCIEKAIELTGNAADKQFLINRRNDINDVG
ncbi:MAG: RNA polymerase sigma factor [Granulosicoccus sp.]